MSKIYILGKRQLGAIPVVGCFLNRPFRCQKHHFKPKRREIFLAWIFACQTFTVARPQLRRPQLRRFGTIPLPQRVIAIT